MSRRIGADEWNARATALNLQWIENAPYRNDIPTPIKCLKCEFEWLASPAHISKGGGCPNCQKLSSRVPLQEWNKRIQAVNATWVENPPETLNDRTSLAECQLCGERWAVIPRLIYKGSGHPRCPAKSNTTVLDRKTWDLRAEKAGIKWLETPINSKSSTSAECLSCGHKWKPIPSNILGGSRCPVCAKTSKTNTGSRISEAEWIARAKKVNITWLNSTPKSSRIKHPAKCNECGYSWEPLPSNISMGSGCPACANNASLPQSVWDERALAIGLAWLSPVQGRHRKSKIKCLTCEKIWMAEAGQVASGAGCPDCGAKKAATSKRLGTNIWIERAEASNLKWLELPENNSIKKNIECQTCGHVWAVIPQTIARGSGCPQCSGTFVSKKTWDERALAVGIKWLRTPTDARKPCNAKCLTCDLEWKPVPDGVRLGSGCPDCAETGYKAGQPGLLYFVERTNGKGRPARKIGITNISSSQVRLALWKRQGFELRHWIKHPDGQVIYDLEQTVLKWLRRDLGLPQYLDREEMPFGGATETIQPDRPTNEELIFKLEDEFVQLKLLRNKG